MLAPWTSLSGILALLSWMTLGITKNWLWASLTHCGFTKILLWSVLTTPRPTLFCTWFVRNQYLDSKVHGANMGPTWGPTGPRWAPCWPLEPCYLGMYHYRCSENQSRSRMNHYISSRLLLGTCYIWYAYTNLDILLVLENNNNTVSYCDDYLLKHI